MEKTISIESIINVNRLGVKLEQAELEISEKGIDGGYVLQVLVSGGAGVYKYQELYELLNRKFVNNVDLWMELLDELTEQLNAYVEENYVSPLVLRVVESDVDGDIQIRAYNVEDLLFLESFAEIA